MWELEKRYHLLRPSPPMTRDTHQQFWYTSTQYTKPLFFVFLLVEKLVLVFEMTSNPRDTVTVMYLSSKIIGHVGNIRAIFSKSTCRTSKAYKRVRTINPHELHSQPLLTDNSHRPAIWWKEYAFFGLKHQIYFPEKVQNPTSQGSPRKL